jgi:hypothetical protein
MIFSEYQTETMVGEIKLFLKLRISAGLAEMGFRDNNGDSKA